MSELDEFLASVLPRLEEADTALHNGDAVQRIAMWSQNAPVTLFGATKSGSGWDQIAPVFNWLARHFSDCQSFKYEVIAAGVSGDLGYLAGIEHTVASLDGAVTKPYSLRVTTILRREDGEWKVVHRHADPLPESEGAPVLVARLKENPDTSGA